MTETKLLELLKNVWNREMSADEAMEELLSQGEKQYARDETNEARVWGIDIHVDLAEER